MIRKNQNKYYRARVLTLIIVVGNIYQIFRPITFFKHMTITNQNLDNSPSGSYTTHIQGINTLEDTMRLATFCFIKQGRK